MKYSSSGYFRESLLARWAGASPAIAVFIASLIILVREGRPAEPAVSQSTGVHLVLGTKEVESSSTFEIRFDDPIVSSEKVGQKAAPSPLVINPAVKGSFTWLSQRSGVFTPDEPLPLSTTLRLSLLPGLQKPDGSRATAELSEIIQTPPMQLKGHTAKGGWDPHDAPSKPVFTLLFNVNVEPDAARKVLRFENNAGIRIPAEVQYEQANAWFSVYSLPDHSVLTWSDLFYQKRQPEKLTR